MPGIEARKRRRELRHEIRRATGNYTVPLECKRNSRYNPRLTLSLVHVGGMHYVPLRDTRTGAILYNADGGAILAINPHPYADMRPISSARVPQAQAIRNNTTDRLHGKIWSQRPQKI